MVNRGKATDSASDKTKMYEVHGDNGEFEKEGNNIIWENGTERVRAVEIDASADRLSSFSTFIVVAKKTLYIWLGAATTAMERKFAEDYVERVHFFCS